MWLRRLHDEVHVTTVFVTHDQEEAMDVADEIVVVNDGIVEQTGPPDELYDRPANDFVMSFLGPVTRLAGRLVRPHDVDILDRPQPGSVPAVVTRLVRLGFEVRVDATAGDDEVWVQLTRAQLERLSLYPGAEVHLRAVTDGTGGVGRGAPVATPRAERPATPARTAPPEDPAAGPAPRPLV